jgi:mannose-1-phosphate guanylyltransferase
MSRWLGHHRPKQYCTFVGNHSMLRHTLNRAEQLTDIERTRVVVARHHEPRLWDWLDDHHEAAIIAQPRNRDTAPGIFLPLTYIATRDPEATVVILPSDHFVHPQEAFVAAIRRAVQAVDCHPERLVLLGVRPDTAEIEYGWIQPGSSIGSVGGQLIHRVAGFREKPGVKEARHLLRSGGLWNTMVIAVRLPTLWKLGWRCFPEMMQHFEDFAAAIGADNEMRALDSLYETLPAVNFSTDLLQQVLDSLLVMELQDVLWSDWGCERRIVETLQRIGKTPLFRNVTMNSPTQIVSAL